MCFGKGLVELCKSRDVERVQRAGGVFNSGGNETGGVGGKMVYIYSISHNFFIQLVRDDHCDSYAVLCWLRNTKWPSIHLSQSAHT